jgi:membrane fusion protein, multidrug efflux system
MLKEDTKAAEQLFEERTQSETGWQDWPGSDDPAYKQRWREKLKVRAPSTLERPVEAPQPELPAKPEPAEAEKGQPAGGSSAPRKSFLRRRPFTSGMFAILLAAALGGGYVYYDYASHFQSTDDAFIAARQIAIAPKISGYVTQVPVTDNQHVPAGGVVARIDPRDYRVALDQANAQVDAAQAAIKNIDAQIKVQDAQINASRAQVDQAKAALVFAKQQAARYEHLAGTGYGTVQNAQQYTSQLSQQEAAVQSTEAALNVAERQIESLHAQRASAEASLEQANAQRDQAKLNLSYTTVTAAVPGRVVNLTAEPGEFAQPGTNLTMFVPDEIWVTANFKETQLDYMRPGQPVTLTIDAYPEREIEGHLASVQPGSGTAFSLLPAQNATGNYVKIVQRVPVKIVIDNPPSDVALGPGMSVEPSVRVNPKPSLYERLASRF